MAANQPERRTNTLVSRLLALDCPYLQGMEESVVSKIVLTPGEARIRVLCWLIEWFQKDLPVDQLNTSISMDASVLTSCLASIGICTKDNLALVEGRTSLQRQLLFLECILDIVEVSQSKDGALSVEQLSREKERLTTILQDREAELHSIMKQHQYEEVNNTVIQSCIKTLAISVGTLTQLVVNFCQGYEAELQPWVGHRQPPALGPLGLVGKRTSAHWSHISKILLSLQQLEATLKRLCNMPIKSTTIDPCHKAQETLQECMADLTLAYS